MELEYMSLIRNGESNEYIGSLIKSEKWFKFNKKCQLKLNRGSWVKLETAGQICAVCVKSNMINGSNLIRKHQCILVI